MQRQLRVLAVLGVVGSLLLASACQPTDLASLPAQASRSIVGGVSESGWLGVGALTYEIAGSGYQGSFCTGTLIGAQWVLTAAHCLDASEGFEPTPALVQFFVGSDAEPTLFGERPSTGSFYQADAFYIHPQWDSATTANDVGLLHLAQPASGVPIYPYNTTAMDGSFVDDSVLYVGFGVTEGINYTGGGIKRSASIPVAWVDPTTYSGAYEGSGVCFGDSGGPGLYQFADGYRVIGINSTVGSGGADPCTGVYNHVRVDVYAGWIAQRLGVAAPSCLSTPSMCTCSQACQANGSCNNSLCQTQSCDQVYGCMGDCGEDQACQTNCYLQGTDSARDQLNTLLACVDSSCAGQVDEALQQCAANACGDALDACFPRVTGSQSCDQIYTCMVGCAAGDTACSTGCYEQGSALAQDQLDAMNSCFDSACALFTDDEAWLDCVYSSCGASIDTCFPPDRCDLRGGDCPTGTACYPTRTGATSCYDSRGVAQGQSCSIALGERLECADGLMCVGPSAATTGRCVPFCLGDGDCAGGDACAIPVFQGLDGVGVCRCVDRDGDGACQADDCNDQSAAQRPGLAELCGDGLDNNCSQGIDEGCGGCIDADHDGYCQEVDCDDLHPGVHPQALERCGDGLDNDCNAQTDEGCDLCTDDDGDGFCTPLDCDDRRSSVYPGSAEKCGDGLDNDCNGAADDGCGSCVDLDGDGYCQDRDCDDSSAEVRPDADEQCRDQVDNNCDGRVDEGCHRSRANDGQPSLGNTHEVALCSQLTSTTAGGLRWSGVLWLMGMWRRRARRRGRA